MSGFNGLSRLEIGGSIFELIEFTLNRVLPDGRKVQGLYGVNVAKVREVIRIPMINPLSARVKGLAGIFELRGVPILAVNLAEALGDRSSPIQDNQQIVVTEFAERRAGFIVDSTRRIRRIAWEKIMPPAADHDSCISGMSLIEDNKFLFILDLERILFDLEAKAQGKAARRSQASYQTYQMGQTGQTGPGQASFSGPSHSFQSSLAQPSLNSSGSGESGGKRGILLVDDSQFILKNCRQALERAGYRVVTATDGLAAQELLEAYQKHPSPHGKIDLVVSDVEMPRKDGLSLTKWIKENDDLREMPVILHTSLAGRTNYDAGMSIGANGYVVKNDIRQLLELIREIIGETPQSHVA